MKSPILNVHSIHFAIGERKLLDSISFSMDCGELLVVIGRNGAGKSTLLKHLTAEQQNSQAQIEILNKDLNSHKLKELAKVRAVLPQSTQLNFAYKVLEVVMLGRIPHQTYQRETVQDFTIAQDCLSRVGLKNYADRDYLTLSGGEQQRVHLARVLAQLENGLLDAPRILFLDEPTSSLDIAHQHQVLSIVKDLTKKNVAVLAILHDLNLAAQYADRILVLSEGKKLAIGKPFEVLTEANLAEAFHHKVRVTKHPDLDCPLII